MPKSLTHIFSKLEKSLRALYGERFSRLVLFGSRARGDAEEGSDIDVLVVLKGGVNADAEISCVAPTTARLSLKHNVVISCVYVSEEQYRREKSPLLINIRREEVLI